MHPIDWIRRTCNEASRKRGRTRSPLLEGDDDEFDDDAPMHTEDIKDGWIAGRTMMRSVGCTCHSGAHCRCDSYPWGETKSVRDDAFAPFLRGAAPRFTNRYQKLRMYVLDMNYGRSGDGTALEIHGTTLRGNSVLLRATGFDPYFYLEVNRALDYDDRDDLVRKFRGVLEENGKPPDADIRIDRVGGLSSAHGFHGRPIEHLYKVTMRVPRYVSTIRGFLYPGPANHNPLRFLPDLRVVRVYEANVDFTLRFCIDIDIRGCSLIEVDWDRVSRAYGDRKRSRAQIEVTCDYRDVVTVNEGEDAAKMPPFTMLSYDIECVNDTGHFPHADEDRVSQICAALWDTRTGNIRKIGFTLGTCAATRGVTTLCFRTEKGLLLAWTEFLREVQPDILTGYNIDHFDNKYLFERAAALGIDEAFSDYSRMKNKWHRAKVRKQVFESSASGKVVSYHHVCAGMVTMDLLHIVRRDFTLRLGSYTLNSVANAVLGSQKDDVHYSELPRLCRKSADTRAIVVRYCVQDAMLPIEIIQKKKYYGFHISLSRTTRTFLRYLIEKGQTAKVKSKLLAQAKAMDEIIPTLRTEEINRRRYEGAYVEYPICGYYGFEEDTGSRYHALRQRLLRGSNALTDRIALLEGKDNPMSVMDFSSLYPSIIIAYNLCYSTQTSLEEVQRNGWVEGEHYTRTYAGFYFVTPAVRKGLLPTICEDLLRARAVEKKLMKEAKARGDMTAHGVHDNNQQSIKVVANSVYGVTGAFWWTNRDISESVTLNGQHLIKKVRSSVEAFVRPDQRWKRVVKCCPESWRGIRIALKRAGATVVGGRPRSTHRPPGFFSSEPTGDFWVVEDPDRDAIGGVCKEQHLCPFVGGLLSSAMAEDLIENANPLILCRAAHSLDERPDWALYQKYGWVAMDVTGLDGEDEGAEWINFPRQAVPVYGDTDSVMMVVSGGTKGRHRQEIMWRMRKELRAESLLEGVVVDEDGMRISGPPPGRRCTFAQWEKKIYGQLLVEESFAIAKVAAAKATVEIGVETGHIPAHELASGRPWIGIVNQYWPPIRIIPEEIYFPFVLLGKKKYFGNMYLSPTQTEPYYTAKGIETKRRDNFQYMRTVLKRINDILIGKIPVPDGASKIDYAIATTQDSIVRLLRGEISCFELVRSAGLKRPVEEYKNDPPHRNLTMRDAAERPGTEAHPGDRVHWVIVFNAALRKVADRAEHPDVVVRERMPIDYAYYAECTMRAAARVFGALIGPASFEGIDYLRWNKEQIEKETKRIIKINTDVAKKTLYGDVQIAVAQCHKSLVRKDKLFVSGELSKVLVHVPRCLRCKCRIRSRPGGRRPAKRRKTNTRAQFRGVYLCSACMAHRRGMVSKTAKDRARLGKELYAAKSRCLNCQKDLYGVVECPIKECRTFFEKIELKNDIEDADALLSRLFPLAGQGRRLSACPEVEEVRTLHARAGKELMVV